MSRSFSSIRWTAVKIFVAPPLFFAVPIVALLLVSGAGRSDLAPFLVQVGVALAAIALVAYGLAPVFARFCLDSVAAGCFFGVLVCAVGALAFGITAAVVYPEFSLRDHGWKLFGLSAVYGFPFAALTGVFFAGAAQRLTPASNPHADDVC